MRNSLCLGLLCFTLVPLHAQVPQQTPSSARALFQPLGDLPGGAFESAAARVSADGKVVIGYGTTTEGRQAFRWTEHDGMSPLGNLKDKSYRNSWAVGISADGAVIVGYGNQTVPDDWKSNTGFRWTKKSGMKATSGLENAARHEAWDVSADGKVMVGDGGQQAYRWTARGGMAGLGTLPGRSNSRAIAVSARGAVITGSSYNLPSWEKEEAYIWTPAEGMRGLGFLPGGNKSFPNALSADGSTIAGTSNSSHGFAAFRWTRKQGMIDLGKLPGTKMTHPGAISGDGSMIAGACYTDREHAVAFVWDAVHGMRSLQSVLETEYGLTLAVWTLENVAGMTPDGRTLVGWGRNPAGEREAFRVVLDVRGAR